ncbi:MAG: orotidine-5'-phosphate decarboxylase [Acidimicrobiales bacterium]|jgi:orotidine-5'-phosphate decarboxylase|nr:orotidine-5'-phosphate decarboxylase [Acidimicrobiales bacterium]
MAAEDALDLSAGAPPEVRAGLALALDVDDLVEAIRLARLLSPWFGVAKVGLELYSAAGPDSIAALVDQGMVVFADLKLLDIPTTVAKAARVMGSLGAGYLTLHTRAGVDHLRAGVEGLAEGAAAVGLPAPTALGVTVLTSEAADPGALVERLGVAVEAGAGGLVCAASDLGEAARLAPGLVRVVPGIRPAGVGADDQARPATPAAAIAGGADLLVVGRAVTRDADPRAAAAALAAEVLAARRPAPRR